MTNSQLHEEYNEARPNNSWMRTTQMPGNRLAFMTIHRSPTRDVDPWGGKEYHVDAYEWPRNLICSECYAGFNTTFAIRNHKEQQHVTMT